MKLVFLIVFIIAINGCTSSTTTKKITGNAKNTSEQIALKAIFESNFSKVPLIYKSHKHFGAGWSKVNSVETLLEKTSSYAIKATLTNPKFAKFRPATTLVNGEPEIDISKKQLTYNIVWDTSNPWCNEKEQCLETEEKIKTFAQDVTERRISGGLICRNVLLWNYLAYGSSIIYNLYDAKGALFYSYEINVNNCPTNRQVF